MHPPRILPNPHHGKKAYRTFSEHGVSIYAHVGQNGEYRVHTPAELPRIDLGRIGSGRENWHTILSRDGGGSSLSRVNPVTAGPRYRSPSGWLSRSRLGLSPSSP